MQTAHFRNPFTHDEVLFIFQHHKSKTVTEISKELKRSLFKIYKFMRDNEISIHSDPMKFRKTAVKKQGVPEGCFDVDQFKEGWLV